MTDTALLLRSDRDLRDRIASIVAMGGAAAVPGNIGPGHERSEWNLWIDPVAAREVWAAGRRSPSSGSTPRTTSRPPSTSGTCSIVIMPAPCGRRLELMASSGMFAGGQYLWTRSPRRRWSAPTCSRGPQARERRDGRRRRGAPGRGSARRARPSRARRRPSRVRAPVPDGADRTDALRDPGARAAPESALRRSGCSYRGPRRTAPGQGTFDTVNDASRPFTHLIGRLHEQDRGRPAPLRPRPGRSRLAAHRCGSPPRSRARPRRAAP